MTRPLRIKDPDKVFLVTIRTENAALWMIPCEELNAILGGILARYVAVHLIELFAFCFLSNHYHLLLRAPLANLDRFCEDLNREVTRRINKLYGRKGGLWGRRYDSQVVIEEVDQVDALLYVVTNPTHHGLVRHPWSWPGLNCFRQLISEEAKDFYFTKYTDTRMSQNGANKIVTVRPERIKHTLKLSILPAWRGLSREDRVARVQELIRHKCDAIAEERRLKSKWFLGVRAIYRQVPGANPREVSCSSRPQCYTRNPFARREFSVWYKNFRTQYLEASYLFRAGNYAVEFPYFSYKPPGHRIPDDVFARRYLPQSLSS